MKSAMNKMARHALPLKERILSHPLARLETALVVFAMVAGIASAALSEVNRKARNEALLQSYKLVPVIVANKDMSVGTVLDEAAMRQTQILANSLTGNAVEPADIENVIGRRLGIELKEGDPILLTAVEGAGMGDTVASRIPPGKRLVTLQVNDRVAANGWIKPNDHVDIIAHMELPARGSTTVTLLEDVTLISVGKATVWENGKSSAGAEIGFFVTPKEVEFISFAQQQGSFSLALRNPKDIHTREHQVEDFGEAGVDMMNFHDHHSLRTATGGGSLDVRVNGKRKKDKK